MHFLWPHLFTPSYVTEISCTVPDHCTESTKRLTKRNLKSSSSKGLGGKRRWDNARSWLEHRRTAVRKAVGGQGEPCMKSRMVISRMAKKLWTNSHKKEADFTKKKQFNRRHLNHIKQIMFSSFFLVPKFGCSNKKHNFLSLIFPRPRCSSLQAGLGLQQCQKNEEGCRSSR